MKRLLLAALLATALSGCGAYKEFTKTTEVNGNLYGKEYNPKDTTTIASLPWMELFKDTCLQRLIDTALVRNADIKTARLRTAQAEATLLAARMSYFPSVNMEVQGSMGKLDRTVSKTYSISGSSSWEIDIFGKVTAAKREALASLEKSRAYQQAVRTSLIASVATTYYTLLMLDEQSDITEQTLRNWQRTVSAMRALTLAGKVNETAVLQAEANRAKLEASLLTIRKSLKETENAMCLLLERTPESIMRGTLAEQVFPDSVSVGIPIQLLANRPDVKEAERTLAKAFYATNAARAAFYPSVNLSGSAGWTNNIGEVILNPGQWLLNAVGSLTQPLLNQGINKANLRIAKAEQEIASAAFQRKLLEAGNEVNNALVSMQTARERFAIDSRNAITLQETVRKTELLMRHSSVNYLEVLTAQQSLLEVRQSIAQDRFEEIQSIINLYHALGGGE